MALTASLDRLRIPAICSPMFIVSGPELVIAQCKAGVVGSMPALNARPQSLLDDWLSQIKSSLADHDRQQPHQKAAPFAVNLIAHKTNVRLDADLATCEKHKVPIVITSLGARAEINQAVHAWGGIVLHDVINQTFAHKAIERGADGLILVAAGAGGKAGTVTPFAFVAETRKWFNGPLVVGGGIGNGRAIRAVQVLGADLAYVGSIFIATEEANAIRDYKDLIVAGTADEIIYTNAFTGIHANYLKSSIRRAGLDPDALVRLDNSELLRSVDEKPAADESTDKKAWRDIWGCGQGIGAMTSITPVAQLVDRLAREYDEACATPFPSRIGK